MVTASSLQAGAGENGRWAALLPLLTGVFVGGVVGVASAFAQRRSGFEQ